MRSGSSQDSRKDLILRPILEAHTQCPDPCWATILLVIFWPGLRSIQWRLISWDSDPNALWTNILGEFTQVVYNLDPRFRPNRLVQKIYNDTICRIRCSYRAERKRWENVDSMDSDDFDESTLLNRKPPEHEALKEKCEMAQRLETYRRRGVISDPECDLFIGTIVYGELLEDFANRMGLGYEAAKKRRQRVVKKIREREKKVKSRKVSVPE